MVLTDYRPIMYAPTKASSIPACGCGSKHRIAWMFGERPDRPVGPKRLILYPGGSGKSSPVVNLVVMDNVPHPPIVLVSTQLPGEQAFRRVLVASVPHPNPLLLQPRTAFLRDLRCCPPFTAIRLHEVLWSHDLTEAFTHCERSTAIRRIPGCKAKVTH